MKPTSSKAIIYVGSFYFPNASPGGTRVLGIGMALRDAGYRVVFAGMEHRGREEDRQSGGGFCYQGFSYEPEKDHGHGRLARLKRALLTHALGITTMRRLHAMDLSTTQAIIAYHVSRPLLWQLMSFCRRRHLPLVIDSTEWYDAKRFKEAGSGPSCWKSVSHIFRFQPRVRSVIAISSLLDRYFCGHGCGVIRIPPLVDMNQPDRQIVQQAVHNDEILRLVYAGSPGKKDLLKPVIRGLHALHAAGTSVELHLVGLSRSTVCVCLGKESALLNDLGDSVIYHGRVPHSKSMSLVAQADFSILLRPDNLLAHAGFPTKLVESLSLGVPIITNLTSDIGKYVCDGKEGIVLDGSDSDAFVDGVRRALSMPRHQWSAMRVHARQRALESFDYRNYVVPLNDFIEKASRLDPSDRCAPSYAYD
jgi:glycosyltransferase involved in cell wall biosynthesis